MRILVSVDMEGLPDVFYTDASAGRTDDLYSESREVMTRLSSALAEGFHSAGVADIIVEDSHSKMTNLYYRELPPYVRTIKGGIRPLDMIYGIDDNVDALALLGFHSAGGVAHSSFDHTYDGVSFHRISVNGEPASEFYLCALVAGEHGVPVILVAGDDKLENDVKSRTPWAEYVVLKNSAGYWSSSYDSLQVVETRLRDSAKKSISGLVPGHAAKSMVLKQSGPFEFIFEMKRSVYADVGELVPGIVRLDGYSLSYRTKTATEGFRVMQLLSYASIGTETSISD